MADGGSLWGLLALGAAATYAPRLAGALLSGRVNAASPLLDWVEAVAYALLAGLISRMILLPVGPLAEIGLGLRLFAVACGVAVFLVSRRNILLGVVAGAAVVVLAA